MWYLSAVRILVDYRPALHERTGVGEFVHELVKALSDQNDPDQPDRLAIFTSSWRTGRIRSSVRNAVGPHHRRQGPGSRIGLGVESTRVAAGRMARRQARCRTQSEPVVDSRVDRSASGDGPRSRLPPPSGSDEPEIRRDYPALARSHASRTHAVIVSSQYAAGEVTRELQLDPARVHVCPPGRPAWADDVRRRRRPASGKHILFMGTLSLRKNVGTLLEAYARLRAKLPDAPPSCSPGIARRCRRNGKHAAKRRRSRATSRSPATSATTGKSICMRTR